MIEILPLLDILRLPYTTHYETEMKQNETVLIVSSFKEYFHK